MNTFGFSTNSTQVYHIDIESGEKPSLVTQYPADLVFRRRRCRQKMLDYYCPEKPVGFRAEVAEWQTRYVQGVVFART
jgi:hypothetical protein